jgi:hypothetical protein
MAKLKEKETVEASAIQCLSANRRALRWQKRRLRLHVFAGPGQLISRPLIRDRERPGSLVGGLVSIVFFEAAATTPRSR